MLNKIPVHTNLWSFLVALTALNSRSFTLLVAALNSRRFTLLVAALNSSSFSLLVAALNSSPFSLLVVVASLRIFYQFNITVLLKYVHVHVFVHSNEFGFRPISTHRHTYKLTFFFSCCTKTTRLSRSHSGL